MGEYIFESIDVVEDVNLLHMTNKIGIDFISVRLLNSKYFYGFAVWDETYSRVIGIFPTIFEAKANLKEYAEHLNESNTTKK